jgi:hypothetical protein
VGHLNPYFTDPPPSSVSSFSLWPKGYSPPLSRDFQPSSLSLGNPSVLTPGVLLFRRALPPPLQQLLVDVSQREAGLFYRPSWEGGGKMSVMASSFGKYWNNRLEYIPPPPLSYQRRSAYEDVRSNAGGVPVPPIPVGGGARLSETKGHLRAAVRGGDGGSVAGQQRRPAHAA